MLILRRRLDETIVVDGRIFITVTWLDGLSVKLGITAPPEVVVDRLEVHREKVADGRAGS